MEKVQKNTNKSMGCSQKKVQSWKEKMNFNSFTMYIVLGK
jgi:hypothetical protein